MSARNNNKKQMAVKPYCKVCHDAGKSEKEYTSHFVKSAPGPEGKVVCPTLLNQCCGYCGSSGHTPKFCQVLVAEKAAEKAAGEKAVKQAARRERLMIEAEKAAAPKPVAQAKPQSRFAAAFGDSDSESDTEPKKVSKKVSTHKLIAPKSVTIVAQPAAKQAAKLVTKIDEFPALPLLAKVDEFPALPTVAKAKITAKPAAKTGFLEALNQVYPELKVAKKMPELPTAYRGPPLAQLVRKQAEVVEEEYEEFPEPSDFIMADCVEEAAYQRQPKMMMASLMDWSEKYKSDSDSDEDW